MSGQMVEALVTGYGLVEGPRVDRDGSLYFTDASGGGVYRRLPDGKIETVVPKRRGVGGVLLHERGGVVLSGRNVCHVLEGETRVLLAVAGAAGFNDMCTDRAGRVYAGSLRTGAFEQAVQRKPGSLYRIDGADRAVELYGDVLLANGVGISPDGRRIYHSDTARKQILVHDLSEDGTCRNRRVFAELSVGLPDGLAVDVEGCVWVAAYGGGRVLRYSPEGRLESEIAAPAALVTSLCFGGDGRRDLYITSADNAEDRTLGGCVFRTRASAAGLEMPLATI